MNKYGMTPLRLFLIIVVGLILLYAAYFQPSSNLPELHIPARGCLFRIETNNTPEFFDEVLVDSRLKIVIDDEVYWIRIEKELTP